MIIPRIRRLYSTSTRRCYGVHPPRHRLARSLTDADTNDIQLSCISLYFAVAAGNDVTFIPLDPPPSTPPPPSTTPGHSSSATAGGKGCSRRRRQRGQPAAVFLEQPVERFSVCVLSSAVASVHRPIAALIVTALTFGSAVGFPCTRPGGVV